MVALTQEQALTRFREKHGDKYDYSKVEYLNQDSKIIIFCKTHNIEFLIRPVKHWNGSGGCKACASEKRQKTNLERYGYSCFLENSNRENLKQTWKKILGVENPFQNEKVNEQLKRTNLERYGVENVSSNENIKNKKKLKCLEKFGVENAYQSAEKKLKIKQTNIERFGVEHQINNVLISDKIKQTMVMKYGVEYALQNIDLRNKQVNSSFNYKNFILSTGKVIKLQGYEPQVLNFILVNKIFSENDFDFDSKLSISYFNKTNRKYFPDFYLPLRNLIIEVKSFYTFFKDLEANMIKRQKCLDLGYNYNFYIWDKKQGLTIL